MGHSTGLRPVECTSNGAEPSAQLHSKLPLRGRFGPQFGPKAPFGGRRAEWGPHKKPNGGFKGGEAPLGCATEVAKPPSSRRRRLYLAQKIKKPPSGGPKGPHSGGLGGRRPPRIGGSRGAKPPWDPKKKLVHEPEGPEGARGSDCTGPKGRYSHYGACGAGPGPSLRLGGLPPPQPCFAGLGPPAPLRGAKKKKKGRRSRPAPLAGGLGGCKPPNNPQKKKNKKGGRPTQRRPKSEMGQQVAPISLVGGLKKKMERAMRVIRPNRSGAAAEMVPNHPNRERFVVKSSQRAIIWGAYQ